MVNVALTITTKEEVGVLDEITKVISAFGFNISYANLYVGLDTGVLNIELENVENLDEFIEELYKIDFVLEIEKHSTLRDIFGKRIIIIGGGAQVSQVAAGAIIEADRHNIRGEHISIDTIPLVGEDNIADAVEAISRLSRVSALILAGSLMGGRITEAVRAVKKERDLLVISLNMPGSVTSEADLIVTDPTQAGVMAVMAIADTAVFDVARLKDNNKF